MFGRLELISLGLMGATFPPTVALSRRYGRAAAARFAGGAIGVLLAQHFLVRLAASRKRARLTTVDALTLSRGLASAVLVGLITSGVRHKHGFAGWLGWGSLVYGSIVCDWLDGPIARRLGVTSELGSLLDLESDSLLTLTAASAAVAWGPLPRYSMVAPVARYALLIAALRNTPYAQIYVAEPPWARPVGIAQMSLFTAALAPFGGRATRMTLSLVTPIIAPTQLMVMMLLHRRLTPDR